MRKIHFFKEEIDFSLRNKGKIKAWILKIIYDLHHFTLARGTDLNFIFCNDQYLHKINMDYLQHDTFTDIITFDQAEKPNTVGGDIFISVERVKENAKNLGIDFDIEIRRVIIHGVLHLLGFKDKTTRDAKLMREKEEICLKIY
ncbi:MAG: rRNA maturation RNase YbeY [Bacteroidetes bacterium]|nr:MAG: rRNA maturation RNase YbeY [Bacteroidota bacterium]